MPNPAAAALVACLLSELHRIFDVRWALPKLLAAAERADDGAVGNADVGGMSRPRRRLPDGAWSAGWRGGRQGGAALVIIRR